jgi:hypothetical protein
LFQHLSNNSICHVVVILLTIVTGRHTPPQGRGQGSDCVNDADVGVGSQAADVVPGSNVTNCRKLARVRAAAALALHRGACFNAAPYIETSDPVGVQAVES